MKVALIADALWLEHEAGMVRHLMVGLTDESVEAVLIQPLNEATGQGTISGGVPGAGESLTYRTSRWTMLRDWRVWGLRKKLAEMEIDVLHAMDESLMAVTLRLGRELGVPVVSQCWSMAGAEVLGRAMRSRGRDEGVEASRDRGEAAEPESAGQPARATNVALMGATGPMVQALREQVKTDAEVRVELVRPGVMRAADDVSQPLRAPSAALSMLVIGNGQVDAPMTAFFEAVARVRTKLTQMQLFLYSTADGGHRWWAKAQEMGLLGQVCLVGPDSGSQRMLAQSDVVLMPQPDGLLRTLMLTTMGAGRPVIAAADPAMDDLIDGTSAMLLKEPTAEQWAQTLIDVPQQADALRELGERAKQYVRQEHGLASYVNRVIEVYRAAVAEPWKFGDL